MAKFQDLTGRKFGRWTVVKRVENNKSGQAQWLCRCECGTERVHITTTLKGGHSLSCGCLTKEVQRKRLTEENKKRLKDLTGKKVGRLTVIKRVENNKHGNPQWLCRCECGNEIVTTGSSLNAKSRLSCGCANRPLDDKIIGKKFGRLTVLRYVESRNQVSYYEAQCDCGNIIITSGSSVYRGESKSCGCLQKETASNLFTKNLIGQKFGRLEVIKKWGKNKNGAIEWLCKCKCGNETVVSTNSLTRGNTKSCGCLAHEHHKREWKNNFSKGKGGKREYFFLFGKKFRLPNLFKKKINHETNNDDVVI